MQTNDAYQSPKAISLEELERRSNEFDVPEGAIEAFKAGASPSIVFLRSTGEQYMISSPNDTCPPAEDRRL